MTKQLWYKLARPDGYDFFTGHTINYRAAAEIKGIVRPPEAAASLGLCSSGVLHASQSPDQCFVRASVPCSVFLVEGTPVIPFDGTKAGFLELHVLQELQPENVFKWHYALAVNPVQPFRLPQHSPTSRDLQNLARWASVRGSVWHSIGDSLRASIWESVRDSVRGGVWAIVWASVRADVRAIVWDSVGDSLWHSVGDSLEAYIGYILSPVVERWKYVKHRKGAYPFMPSASLWNRGLVPSFDGKLWRLHSGPQAEVVWKGRI